MAQGEHRKPLEKEGRSLIPRLGELAAHLGMG